jgi:hypothetical protein
MVDAVEGGMVRHQPATVLIAAMERHGPVPPRSKLAIWRVWLRRIT